MLGLLNKEMLQMPSWISWQYNIGSLTVGARLLSWYGFGVYLGYDHMACISCRCSLCTFCLVGFPIRSELPRSRALMSLYQSSARGFHLHFNLFFSSCNAIVWPFNIIPDYWKYDILKTQAFQIRFRFYSTMKTQWATRGLTWKKV